jgi:betaine-aldehyde dehydrogenase
MTATEITVQNIIDGKPADAVSGATTPIVDPCTGEAYGTAPLSAKADVDAAYGAAAVAAKQWGRSTPSERMSALLKLANAIEDRADEITQAECRNTGKPLVWMRDGEIPDAVDQLRFFAGAARMLEGTGATEYLSGHTSYVRREPLGVVGQVAPWNYPFMMAVWKIGPALAGGNTVVLKPSDTTPVTTALLGEIAADILPPGVLNIVCGGRDTGRVVVQHKVPALVSITGSTRAGYEVAESAAAGLKKAHLELGGKAPCIVFADADLPKAARALAEAGFGNAGQDCTAAARILVQEPAAEEFTRLLVAEAESLHAGPPSDAGAYFGPLNNANQLERVEGFFARIPDHAAVLTGGKRQGDVGFFFPPTVVAGLRQHDEMVQSEIFGPVITVQTFESEREAVLMANDVEYGLASSVFTSNHNRAMRVTRELDFGCVWVNSHIPLVAEMPHGGFKHSGYGKDLSMYSLEDYTRVKHVMHAFED